MSTDDRDGDDNRCREDREDITREYGAIRYEHLEAHAEGVHRRCDVCGDAQTEQHGEELAEPAGGGEDGSNEITHRAGSVCS